MKNDTKGPSLRRKVKKRSKDLITLVISALLIIILSTMIYILMIQ